MREIRHLVDEISENLKAKQEYYLNICDEIGNDTLASDMDELGTDIKSLSGSLISLEFLKEYLTNPRINFQGRAFGAACAIQVRPQDDFLIPLVNHLNDYSESEISSEIKNFRMKVIYRILMALESIIRMDARRTAREIGSEEVDLIIRVLNKLSSNQSCLSVLKDHPKGNIITRINKIKKFIDKEYYNYMREME